MPHNVGGCNRELTVFVPLTHRPSTPVYSKIRKMHLVTTDTFFHTHTHNTHTHTLHFSTQCIIRQATKPITERRSQQDDVDRTLRRNTHTTTKLVTHSQGL